MPESKACESSLSVFSRSFSNLYRFEPIESYY
jgi:hypothetical protein